MSIISPEKNNICCIIISYFPDCDFPKRIENIINQVEHVIIIDNNSNKSEKEMIQLLLKKYKISIILNETNVGIAKALNQGLHYAEEQGYKWALLLDQDTIVYDTIIEKLVQAYVDCPFKNKVAILAANYKDKNTSLVSSKDSIYEGKPWVEVKTAITSGSLISIKAFLEVGDFRDDFFIDAVDDEYCLRLKTARYKIIRIKDVVMIHVFGISTIHNLFCKKVVTSNHSALRRYYMYRNNIGIFKIYFFKEPVWCIKCIYNLTIIFIFILLFDEYKVSKIKFIIRGIIDGIVNRTGKCEYHK